MAFSEQTVIPLVWTEFSLILATAMFVVVTYACWTLRTRRREEGEDFQEDTVVAAGGTSLIPGSHSGPPNRETERTSSWPSAGSPIPLTLPTWVRDRHRAARSSVPGSAHPLPPLPTVSPPAQDGNDPVGSYSVPVESQEWASSTISNTSSSNYTPSVDTQSEHPASASLSKLNPYVSDLDLNTCVDVPEIVAASRSD